MLTKYLVVTVSVAIMIGLAYLSLRRTHSYTDYNLAGRRLGFSRLVSTLGAAEFNTATLIGGTSVAYLYGVVGLYYTSLQQAVVFGTYALTVARPYRRLQITTVAEFFERRFSDRFMEPTRALASLVTLTFTWIAPATYLAGMAVVTSVLLGVDTLPTIIAITGFSLAIGISAGFMTSVSFDVLAYVMILIFIPTIFLIGWKQSGGFSELSTVFEAEYLSFAPNWDVEDYGFAAVLTWCFQNVMLYIAAPWYGQRVFSARNEKIAYRAMLGNTVLITTLYALVVMATWFSRVLMPDLKSPEEALPRLVESYAPPLVQGLLLVTLLLVGMSTIIAIWNSAVSIVINDFVRRYFAQRRSDEFYIWASRTVFVVLAISTAACAITFIGSILLVLTYVSVFTALLAFPILAGLYWRRFTALAALSSLVVGVLYVTLALLLAFPYYLISPVGVALGVVIGVGVTLTCKNDESSDHVTDFFNLARKKVEIKHDVSLR